LYKFFHDFLLKILTHTAIAKAIVTQTSIAAIPETISLMIGMYCITISY